MHSLHSIGVVERFHYGWPFFCSKQLLIRAISRRRTKQGPAEGHGEGDYHSLRMTLTDPLGQSDSFHRYKQQQ